MHLVPSPQADLLSPRVISLAFLKRGSPVLWIVPKFEFVSSVCLRFSFDFANVLPTPVFGETAGGRWGTQLKTEEVMGSLRVDGPGSGSRDRGLHRAPSVYLSPMLSRIRGC